MKSEHQVINCTACAIYDRGFCDKFQLILRKIANHLQGRYSQIPLEDRKDIFTITIESVVTGVDRFKGERGVQFASWVWQIYKNKVNDYFRIKKPICFDETISYENPNKCDLLEKTEIKLMISECFKKYLSDDTTGCVRLYLDLYRFLQQGKTQKELAEAYYLTPNTMNQRIRRCRKVMKQLFKDCLD